MKATCPVFDFLDLDRRILHLIFLRSRWKGQHLHCFWFFFFNPPAQLWMCGPDLSTYNKGQLRSKNIKIDNQHAFKKVLDLKEKWNCPKFRGKFQFFLWNLLLTWCITRTSKYSSSFSFFVFCSQDEFHFWIHFWTSLNVSFLQMFWFHFQIQLFNTAMYY